MPRPKFWSQLSSLLYVMLPIMGLSFPNWEMGITIATFHKCCEESNEWSSQGSALSPRKKGHS